MKRIRNKTALAMVAATALLVAGCTKENIVKSSDPTPGHRVSVTLPLTVTDSQSATAASATQTTASTSKSAPGKMRHSTAPASEGFTVSFGEPITAAAPLENNDTEAIHGNRATEANTASPATRTIAQQLSNVWVLQFNASGQNVSTANIGNLAAGEYLTPTLMTGTGYTICIVANGLSSGLSTSNPATLADFETKLLSTSANAAVPRLSGKLTGVTVVDMGGGNGKISLADANTPMVVMRRIRAEINLTVDFAVTGYTLIGTELYNVPKGTPYGWNNATTTFPDAIADNFDYTSTSSAGMKHMALSTSGTETTYKWFVGDNRRGDVTGITAQTERHSGKAPAYSTFARVTLRKSTDTSKKIYYDIYLGSGNVTNFDLLRNHTYTITVAIKGTADYQESLVGIDARVSGVGDFPIWLTDNRADSPILISPKSMESTTKMLWGPTTPSISGAQDIFNGKTNTNAIMATSATNYPAAKYCRDKGSQWDLPAIAQLMLMWVYLPAIPEADRPTNHEDYFWSSTEDNDMSNRAWVAIPSVFGVSIYDSKSLEYYVRCVREN